MRGGFSAQIAEHLEEAAEPNTGRGSVSSLARAIDQMVAIGGWMQLERFRGESNAESLFRPCAASAQNQRVYL